MGKNNLKNLLICGDNLQALDDLKKQKIKVDLIYLDPPFFSNRHYEVVWGDEAEVRSFKDRWSGGIHVYIEWMKERIVKMHDILKDAGSFYLHCDWHASHYLKVMLDEVFGVNNFTNEIVWVRSLPHGNIQKKYGSSHDIIFFYKKSNDAIWNGSFLPHRPEYIEQFFRYNDVSGRRYRLVSCINPNPDRPNLTYGWKGVTKVWKYTKDKMKKMDENNLLVYSRNGIPQYKYYLDQSKGRPTQDAWIDIPPLMGSAKERLGYPTQKPESLLGRVINASSRKDGLVLDPFCGCGTAMVVAQKLQRKWIGIDISPTAINLIEKRLEKIGANKGKDFDSIGMPTTISALKKLEPFEFQNWVVNEMQAKQSPRKTGDQGIDGFIEDSLYTKKAGIQVKQSEKVGRNVVDNFETALERKGYKKGYIVAFSFTRGIREEVARAKGKDLYIKLIEVDDLLKRKPGLLK